MEDDIITYWDKAEINNALLENKNFEKFRLRNSDILLESIIRNEYDIFKRILNSKFKLNNNNIIYIISIVKNYKNDYFKYIDELNKYINIKYLINTENNILHTSIVNYAIEKEQDLLINDLSIFGIDWNKKYNNQSLIVKLLNSNIGFNQNLINDIKNNEIDDKNEILKVLKNKSKDWCENNKYLLEIFNYDYK